MHAYGVDTTNHPGGIGYGEYLVKLKLKPNLDHYLSNMYAYEFSEHNMPHIEGHGSGNTGTSYHSILANTYTINDVDEISSLDDGEIVYSSKDEKFPSYEQLKIDLKSTEPKLVIKAIENIQTYHSGQGEFLKDIEFLQNTSNVEILNAYFNAIYNYGHKQDLAQIIEYEKSHEVIDNRIIARLANCVERFGEPGKCDEIIKSLINKATKNNVDKNSEYAFLNIKDAIQKTHFDKNNQYKNIKEFLKKDNAYLQAIAIFLLATTPFTDDKTDKEVAAIKEHYSKQNIDNSIQEAISNAIRTYENCSKLFRKK